VPPNQTLIDQAAALAAAADVTILALGLGSGVEGESLDRSYLTFPQSQAPLLAAVRTAAVGKRVVLAINSANGVDLDASCCDAIVQLWYGGQETGHGLADVLFGRVAPSGRMPITVHPTSYLTSGIGPVHNLSMVFENGQGRTYRYLANQSRDALWSFGWGLSYTAFRYSDVHVQVMRAARRLQVSTRSREQQTGTPRVPTDPH
jgi:beta-glucosidase